MKPHEEWLFKAEHDIESASILMSANNPLYNLKILVENCMEINGDFKDILDDCIFLSPYAILYRYPEGDLMPVKETVIQAISKANKILKFIRNKINAKQ